MFIYQNVLMTKLFYRFNKNKFTNVQTQEQMDSFEKKRIDQNFLVFFGHGDFE